MKPYVFKSSSPGRGNNGTARHHAQMFFSQQGARVRLLQLSTWKICKEGGKPFNAALRPSAGD